MIAGSLGYLLCEQLRTTRVCCMQDHGVKLFLEKKIKMPIKKVVLTGAVAGLNG